MDINYFKQKSIETKNEVIKIRKRLHQYPELSFQEVKTQEFICKTLDKWQIEYIKNIGNVNSVIAIIKGKNKNKNKNIALRADIDALPITEKTKLSFKSKNKGIMHACGHDVHTALLLGAIYIINEVKENINGTVYAIFQPAEEKLPGGALSILNDNFFKSLKLDAVLAYHTYPSLPAGKIGLHCGKYMASTDEIYITVKGRGGHAATPHIINDTVLTSANIIITLNQLLSRLSDPLNPSVISFGKIIANGATNIVPDFVQIEGTFRTFDESFRKNFLKQAHVTIETVCKNFNCNCEIVIKNGYPVLTNDSKLYNLVKNLSSEFLGQNNIIDIEKRTTSEDFAYFSQKYKALMIRLGTGGNKNTNHPLHSSYFNVNDKIFDFAHGLLAFITISLMNKKWEEF